MTPHKVKQSPFKYSATPSSIAPSKATGRFYGSTPPTSRCGAADASSRSSSSRWASTPTAAARCWACRSARRRPSRSGRSSSKLTRRGLRGVKLVVSDAHEGLKAAVTKVLSATWQRRRVHFMRNVLAHAGKSGRRVVSAFIATALRPRRRRPPSTPCDQRGLALRPDWLGEVGEGNQIEAGGDIGHGME